MIIVKSAISAVFAPFFLIFFTAPHIADDGGGDALGIKTDKNN
jgi:hypothetical protein